MKILILGQGGREHALAYKISQSPDCQGLYIAPGNGGTAAHGENIPLDINDAHAVCSIIEKKGVDLVVIGPEAPLANGVADAIREALPDVGVIGPGQKGAQLESSKAFAKDFMERYNIPTAKYRSFEASNLRDGLDYIDQMQPPIVLKADGLAAGKGVIISQSHDEAKLAFKRMLDGQFGAASARVVVEEYLSGREYSVFILTDGDQYYLLPVAKDYKRIGEGDQGLNTGGMGAVSPVSYVDETLLQKTISGVIEPTLSGLKQDRIPYSGFIFFGMIEVNGDPYVIEYNCRMGDPETEVVIPRLASDLVKHLTATNDHSIAADEIKISDKACAAVMMVSGGYPESYEKGKVIEGLEDVHDAIVFHAGTARDGDKLYTNGGRVIAVTALEETDERALVTCYRELNHIRFDKQYYRTDIGFDL